MSGNTFHLRVVTPEKIFFEGDVRSMVVPGGGGSFGVLANHAPIISTLCPGRLVLTTPDGQRRILAIGPGFLDVLNNEATLAAETVTDAPDEKPA
ncbi:MAG: ATP synthase F1 subunit epsilon [Nitrospiria bacterium]